MSPNVWMRWWASETSLKVWLLFNSVLPSYAMHFTRENRSALLGIKLFRPPSVGMENCLLHFHSPSMLFEKYSYRYQDLLKNNLSVLPGYSACTDLVKIFTFHQAQSLLSCYHNLPCINNALFESATHLTSVKTWIKARWS